MMKLLFAANRFPYPPYRGDKLKIYNLAKRLSVKHELHLLTFLEDETDLQYLEELKKIFTEIHLVKLPKKQSYWNVLKGIMSTKPLQVAYFESAAMHEKVKDLLHQHTYDAVHVQHLRMAQYFEHQYQVPRILDLPDAYSLYWKRRIEATSGFKKIFNSIEFKRVKKYEQVLNRFNQTLVCSKEDKNWLEQEQHIHKVGILPNGVDTTTFHNIAHDYTQEKTILFTGNMDYAPNVDAVQYFAKEIFPILQQQFPKVKFVIAGQRPVEAVLALQSDSIEVTGFIKDLKEVYKTAAIVVAPLRFGAGTQNKVLEAMAMAVPVVSMNVGFQGLNIESGEGVILATDTTTFIKACSGLLADKAQRQTVGEMGKRVIQTQFDWDVVSDKLIQYFNLILRKA
ncbi:hypothetical protein DBR32_10135 [Taibaiella sp. KBW10]|uniref:glycosyltransferase n=1 Tax=Taibaiella sp. KBW10 TaxID=2153357 RepID=UPI000F5A6713|nr:glycosyltransferase [Taibaiella sp. KBW10]RQO31055.1 hypothetical protein DBR32_10135 [Taibaiella sp. KBW10]